MASAGVLRFSDVRWVANETDLAQGKLPALARRAQQETSRAEHSLRCQVRSWSQLAACAPTSWTPLSTGLMAQAATLEAPPKQAPQSEYQLSTLTTWLLRASAGPSPVMLLLPAHAPGDVRLYAAGGAGRQH